MNTEDRIRIEQNRTKNANSLLKDFKTTTITKRKDLFILNDVCTKGGGNDSVGEGWACSKGVCIAYVCVYACMLITIGIECPFTRMRAPDPRI